MPPKVKWLMDDYRSIISSCYFVIKEIKQDSVEK